MLLRNPPEEHGPERMLWLAVLAQAKDDLELRPMNSLEYASAAAFFTGGGEWAESRQEIAIQLDLDPETLRHMGKTWIAARREAAGLPAEEPQPTLKAASKPAPLPVITCTPAQPLVPPEPRVTKPPKSKKIWAYNPFNPLLRTERRL
jgi:hypothetical protein